MAKNKNWFERLKRFFSSETKSRKDKKEKKRKKVWLFGRVNSRCPPPLPPPSAKPQKEEEEEEEEEAVAVAVAVATAAEAAVAAAHVASPNGGPPLSYHRVQELAAIKIETAFRALLARRALRALKGLVKLQALIRGQAVRRQTTATLRGLQSLMKIQSQARASRLIRAAEEDWAEEEKYMVYGKATGSTLQQSIHRRWDRSSLSKEELTVLLSNRREAAMKRERAIEYAFSRQERRRPMTPVSKEFEANFRERRWSWLDQWVGAQPLDRDRDMIPEVFPSPRRDQKTQLRCLARRRSFTQSRRASLRDYDSFSGSPSLPSYMASTASAKARSRSLSTPRQQRGRLGTIDSCSENCVPYDAGGLLSPLPSNASEAGLGKSSRSRARGEAPVKIKCLSFGTLNAES